MPPHLKTVYVLGAGFAAPAGLPVQAAILDRIRAFLLRPDPAPLSAEDEFGRARASLTEFLQRAFPSQTAPPLEDIFTLLDHSISRREHTAGEPWVNLELLRRHLNLAILFIINEALRTAPRHALTFYRSLAAHFLDLRLDARQPGDPFSFILLNWDNLIDTSIFWCVAQARAVRRADIDYCCYTTALHDSPHIPSLTQRAHNLFNVKLVKLHGSANWLFCPNCNRMYTGLGSATEFHHRYVVTQYCPSCAAQRGISLDSFGGIPLAPFLITPTYLKVFDNPHIQMAWHNAQVELSEAANIVFVGYSLPEADYHFRTLLRRSIRQDTSITAVLNDTSSPPRNCPVRARAAYAVERYRAFFGDGRVRFDLRGAEGYFRAVIGRDSLRRRIVRLRRRFSHLPPPR